MKEEKQPVWFITGCSTGFGRELSKLILQRGWNAVVTSRKLVDIQDITEEYDDHSLALSLDVTQKDQVSNAVAKAEEKFGKIDVLVNNAGYGYFSSIEEGE